MKKRAISESQGRTRSEKPPTDDQKPFRASPEGITLRGKYRRAGLLSALMEEKKREREL